MNTTPKLGDGVKMPSTIAGIGNTGGLLGTAEDVLLGSITKITVTVTIQTPQGESQISVALDALKSDGQGGWITPLQRKMS